MAQGSLARSLAVGTGRSGAVDEDVQAPADVPVLWPHFLRLRDELRSVDAALLIGRDVRVLGVLLAREGVRVRALDAALSASEDEAIEGSGDMADSEDGEFGPLTSVAIRDALGSGGYDAVVVVDGYRFELSGLLAMLGDGASTRNATLLVDVPFGAQVEGDAGFVLPRLIAGASDAHRVNLLDIVDHRIRLRLVPVPGPEESAPSLDLLSVTERGARQKIEELESRVAVLSSELEETRANWSAAEFRAREMSESTALRTAFAVSAATRSPRAMLGLPGQLLRILGDRKRRKQVQKIVPVVRKGLTEWDKETIRAAARQAATAGADEVIGAVDALLPNSSGSLLSFAYLVAAQACGAAGRHDVEFEVATRALELNQSIGMLRGYLHVALRCRRMAEASETLRKLHKARRDGNKIARDFLRHFSQTSSYKIAVLESIPERPERWAPSTGNRLAYVLHNSLPFSSGGYATRSHGVAVGLVNRGHDVVCVTRPGFPLDVKPDLAPVDVPIVERIEGVTYQRVSEPSRLNIPEYRYVLAAADRLEAELRRLAPAYVQAASNYVTGLPALIAARRLGIPFIYEVRGLWEITRMSRDQQFAESISFDVQRHLEGTLAREADHVFTLTEPMREELVERGVDPERITLLPNSVDANRFTPSARDEGLASELQIPADVPVIGYVGTFVIYEGLEHLVEACVKLHQQGVDFRLLLVGNENASGQELGPITEEILRIAREAGIESKLILTGRVPHEQVESYYSLVDICPFPRKPWPVCEMVSPMKPLEALALKKAVVVSSVRALTEMIQDGRTGVVFEKGNVDSLAAALRMLIESPQLREQLGESGREWVVHERSWLQVAEKIESILARFDSERARDDDATVAAGPA